MITLSSDFGSPYPAAMKGRILRETDTQLVDVSHDFPRQDVRTAAFWLREVLPEFPPAVHLVVVDPGVGTDRAAIAIRAGDHALVGPDNGVLVPAARALAGDAFEVFRIDDDDPESATFHGRDVFAPAAAAIHQSGIGRFEDHVGFSRAGDVVDLHFPDPDVDGSAASGEVLVVDGFGNVITNVDGEVLDGHVGSAVTVNDQSVPACHTYADVDEGDQLVTVGSHGNVELAVNQGRGDEAFGLTTGDRVGLRL